MSFSSSFLLPVQSYAININYGAVYDNNNKKHPLFLDLCRIIKDAFA